MSRFPTVFIAAVLAMSAAACAPDFAGDPKERDRWRNDDHGRKLDDWPNSARPPPAGR